MQKLMFTNPGPRVQTTQQYLTTCRIQGMGSADGTTITQVTLMLLQSFLSEAMRMHALNAACPGSDRQRPLGVYYR